MTELFIEPDATPLGGAAVMRNGAPAVARRRPRHFVDVGSDLAVDLQPGYPAGGVQDELGPLRVPAYSLQTTALSVIWASDLAAKLINSRSAVRHQRAAFCVKGHRSCLKIIGSGVPTGARVMVAPCTVG